MLHQFEQGQSVISPVLNILVACLSVDNKIREVSLCEILELCITSKTTLTLSCVKCHFLGEPPFTKSYSPAEQGIEKKKGFNLVSILLMEGQVFVINLLCIQGIWDFFHHMFPGIALGLHVALS